MRMHCRNVAARPQYLHNGSAVAGISKVLWGCIACRAKSTSAMSKSHRRTGGRSLAAILDR